MTKLSLVCPDCQEWRIQCVCKVRAKAIEELEWLDVGPEGSEEDIPCTDCQRHYSQCTCKYEDKDGPDTAEEVETEESEDLVNSPSHYANSKYEVIDYMEDKLTEEQFEGYCIGNVIKYISRYRHKNGLEDLQKARWYLNKAIETKEKVEKT